MTRLVPFVAKDYLRDGVRELLLPILICGNFSIELFINYYLLSINVFIYSIENAFYQN